MPSLSSCADGIKDENAETVQARSQSTERTHCDTVGWAVLNSPLVWQKVDSEGAKLRATLRKFRDLTGKHFVGIAGVNDLQIRAQVHHEVQFGADKGHGPLPYKRVINSRLLRVADVDPGESSGGR